MNGTMEIHEVDAPSLEGNPLKDPARRRMPVYLPPGYAQGRERYPTVYFLHGFTGSALGWLNVSAFQLTVPERIDRLIEQGQVPPFIGVFVDGWTAVGGSQWINSEAIGRYEDYVVKDVVGWADQKLRTVPKAPGRAVVGKSSGGYGALVLASKHPELFGALGCHAGDACFEYCYLPDLPKAASVLLKAGGVESWFKEFCQRARETKPRSDDHLVINVLGMAAAYSPRSGQPLGLELPIELETGRLLPEVWNRWLEHDPVRFLPNRLAGMKRLGGVFIDCGTKDEFNLRWGARMIAAQLRAAGIPSVHEEFDDGHMGTNYRYDRSLISLVPKLARG